MSITPLNVTVLLVEDDVLLGLDLATTLCHAGIEVIGPVIALKLALREAREEAFDAGVLDIDLGGTSSFPVADILAGRGIPFMFLADKDTDLIPERHAGRVMLRKPCFALLTAAVLRLVQPRAARG